MSTLLQYIWLLKTLNRNTFNIQIKYIVFHLKYILNTIIGFKNLKYFIIYVFMSSRIGRRCSDHGWRKKVKAESFQKILHSSYR